MTTASEKTLDQLMTQDETWIYLNNPRKTMWIKEGHEPPINVKQNIGSKKVMISVIWSRTGVKSITMLPPGQKFNKEFYLDKVIGNFAKKYKTKVVYGRLWHAPAYHYSKGSRPWTPFKKPDIQKVLSFTYSKS